MQTSQTSQTGILHSPALLAFAAALIVALGAAFVDHRENAAFDSQLRTHVLEHSTALASKLDQRINLYIGALYTAEAIVIAHPHMDRASFETITKVVTQHLPGFTSIQLAPDAIIAYAYPLEWGKKVTGVNLRKDLSPANIKVVEQTIADGKLRVAGPRELVQGSTGIIARNPIYVDGAFWGFVTILVDFPTFLEAYPELSNHQDIDFALRGQDGLGALGAVFLGDPHLFDTAAIKSLIRFPNGEWQLAARPKGGWDQPRPNATLFRLLSLLLIGAVGALAYAVKARGNRILHLATTDPLTGIFARGQFNRLANTEIERSKRHQRPLALLMLDIDHFKKINDTYGHAAGDLVLKAVTHRVAQLLRTSDVFGRIGGEEFAILAPETQQEQALVLAERVRQGVLSLSLAYGQHTITISTSCGVALIAVEASDLDTLLLLADRALYHAKNNGRNQVCVAPAAELDAEMNEENAHHE
ncbi:MAG: diguanylate cyclase [Pseudomonadota bacterium]